MNRVDLRTNSGSVTKAIVLSASAAAVVVTTIVVLSAERPMIAVQLATGLMLVVITASVQASKFETLPVLIRPASVVCAALIVGTWAASSLPDREYLEYLTLWVTQVFGAIVAMVLTQPSSGPGSPTVPKAVNRRGALKIAYAVIVASTLSALVFFAMQGIPVLGSDVEQGRVDAAAEGTGYLRLVAYLSIPASLALVALRARGGIMAVGLSTLIIIGMANRSPLLYLFAPLIFILFAQGRVRITSLRIVAAGAILATLIVSIGTFRVFSQEEFANYDEYRVDIAAGNYIGVAATSLEHYAKVVTENAVLTKSMVDSGTIETQFGTTYLTLFISALPGEQLSLDRQIKEASGKDFVGGGTPPTMMGEGYVNFGLPGTFLSAFFAVAILVYWGRRLDQSIQARNTHNPGLTAAIYGFFVTWVALAQVAGFAGASTFPLAGSIVLFFIWKVSIRNGDR